MPRDIRRSRATSKLDAVDFLHRPLRFQGSFDKAWKARHMQYLKPCNTLATTTSHGTACAHKWKHGLKTSDANGDAGLVTKSVMCAMRTTTLNVRT